MECWNYPFALVFSSVFSFSGFYTKTMEWCNYHSGLVLVYFLWVLEQDRAILKRAASVGN